MDNKQNNLYKILITFITILLMSLKVGFLYISYIISNILNITGFVSILFIVFIWTCFNSLLEFIYKSILLNNTEKDSDNNGF